MGVRLANGEIGNVFSQYLFLPNLFNCRVCKVRYIPLNALIAHAQKDYHIEHLRESYANKQLAVDVYESYVADDGDRNDRGRNTFLETLANEYFYCIIGLDAILEIQRNENVEFACRSCAVENITMGNLLPHLTSDEHCECYLVSKYLSKDLTFKII